jgi:ABC-type uncharacterized transport system ATPase subunit
MTKQSDADLKLHNVHRRFGGFAAVTAVSETFAAGELVSIIGPNGAGKSTLLNMICGTLPVSEGEISYGAQKLSGLSPERIAKLGIARKFQVPSVFNSLSVRDNLELAVPQASKQNELERIMETVHLTADRDLLAGTLPHGKKQWLEIGMALAMDPKVLLLDEPTAGLSPDETHATATFLKLLRGQVTTIVIEHDMAFVRELGARTIVLHQGSILASGPFEDIERDETVRNVYLGRA